MVESDYTVDKPMNLATEAEQTRSICSCSNKKELIIRGKLKEAILSKLAASANASNPSMSLSPDLIQLRLAQYFPTFRTPFHPPYFFMIRQAIKKLNEEGGSTEEAISRFIEKEYEGLPWAHASFLSHHLKKLCRNEEILCVNNERYMLPKDDGDFGNKEEMSHGSNIANREGKDDRTLVQANGRETEAIKGWSGVKFDQTEESKYHFENKRQTVEVNGQTKACEPRILGFEEEKEGKQESVKEVREESQNNDFGNKEEMSHGSNIANRDGKEDQILVQANGRETEAIDGWSGVKCDQTKESKHQFENERQSVEVNGQTKACEPRILGFEEEKEGKQESVKEVREESQNGDFGNEEEMSHGSNIANRDGKEGQTFVQANGRETEAIDWSGVKCDQTEV